MASLPLRRALAFIACVLPLAALAFPAQAQTIPDLVIKDGTVMTASHGTIQHGAVWVHNGKISAVGTVDEVTKAAPANATVVSAAGKYVTPGIVDPHSHSALGNDVNEATSPVTPSMMMIDAFDNTDRALYFALAGGVTTELLLHGSANMIGGQNISIKNRFGRSRDEMIFAGAPRTIKFASGENPKRVYGSRNQLPSTRMGNFEVMRQSFEDAKVYMAGWDAYNDKVAKGDKTAVAPHRDLKLDALSDVLRGKLLVEIHCYRADEFLTEEAIAKQYGYKIRAFHHALEMYKVGPEIAADGTGIATFADWWGFKDEAWDAIPWNAVMSMREGVKVSLKSDSNDFVRRLNQEAGKMVHYGGATEDEAIRMVTLNAAWIMGVDDKVGSLDKGKDGDIVIWNTDPLSSYARAEKVYIDGDLYFDSSLPGYGLTHFTGVMHGGGFSGSDDDSAEDAEDGSY
jgi:imidazolonepropionase-like amidohydrolase